MPANGDGVQSALTGSVQSFAFITDSEDADKKRKMKERSPVKRLVAEWHINIHGSVKRNKNLDRLKP